MTDFQALYERYATDLYRFAIALCGNPAEAEDLVADTFVRLWTAPGDIREVTVKAYLFTIVRNLFLTGRRKTARYVPLDESVADSRPSVDDRAAARSELAQLKRHLAALPDIDRAVLSMRSTQGSSYEDIGAAFGLSVGAARVRVHRARAQLAKAIGRTMESTS